MTTSAARVRACCTELVDPRPSCFRATVKCPPPACKAGARPKIRPEAHDASQAEEDDTPADGDIVKPRHALRHELQKRLFSEEEHEEARDSAGYGEKQALGKKLLCETRPARSECLTNSHFAFPCRLARASRRLAMFTQPRTRTNPIAGEGEEGADERSRRDSLSAARVGHAIALETGSPPEIVSAAKRPGCRERFAQLQSLGLPAVGRPR